jgi:hypothetical protein
MKLNFYGFDTSYQVARYNFVYKVPHSRTPLHLAIHRARPVPGTQPGQPDSKICTGGQISELPLEGGLSAHRSYAHGTMES